MTHWAEIPSRILFRLLDSMGGDGDDEGEQVPPPSSRMFIALMLVGGVLVVAFGFLCGPFAR
jgi:hypothetical protein